MFYFESYAKKRIVRCLILESESARVGFSKVCLLLSLKL